jgi:glutaredoxin
MLRFLRSLWPRPAMNRLHFVLYTRQNCHLCEDAWLHLQKEQRRHGFELHIIDVDSDQSLAAKFGEMVPVITVDGQVRLWGHINTVLLTRLLRGEARKNIRDQS